MDQLGIHGIGDYAEVAGKRVRVGAPDSVQVLTTHEDGSRGVYRLSGVTWHENVVGEEKQHLLARARAMLFPIQWEEPFGIAMVEAMVSGTPVIALARGAANEIVEPGVTGWLVAAEVASAAGGRRVYWAPGMDDAESLLRDVLEMGDVLLTLGAGDVDKLAERLVEPA